MAENKKGSLIVVSRDYTFNIFRPGRLIVVATRTKSEGELAAITEAYEEWRKKQPYYMGPLKGGFRLCLNPECFNAFNVRRSDKTEKGKGLYCSPACFYSVRRLQGGQPAEWTDGKLAKAIRDVYEKGGRENPRSLYRENRNVYNVLLRRVKRGEFGSTEEAIEKIFFRCLAKGELICWLLDEVASRRDPEAIERLNRARERELERVKALLQEICKEIPGEIPCPARPEANRIMREFFLTEEGEKLRSLIE